MEDKEIKVYFSTGVKYKGTYFLSAMYMNALFMYDEKNNKMMFLSSFQKEKGKFFLFLKSFLYNNQVWFIPYNAEQIAIVDLDTFSIEYIAVPYKKQFGSMYGKYGNILWINDDFLCMVPQSVDTAIIVDLKNKKLKAYHDIVKSERMYQSAVYNHKKVYFFPWTEKNILVLDLETGDRSLLEWKAPDEFFGDVVYDRKLERLFHAPAKAGYIMLDNMIDGTYQEIRLGGSVDCEYKTFYSTDYDENIFFWGIGGNIILKVNKNSNDVKMYQIGTFPGMIPVNPIFSEDIEALLCGSNCLIKYDAGRDAFYETYLKIKQTDLFGRMEELNLRAEDVIWECGKDILYENEKFDLQYFLSFVLPVANKKVQEVKSGVGSEIYKNVLFG